MKRSITIGGQLYICRSAGYWVSEGVDSHTDVRRFGSSWRAWMVADNQAGGEIEVTAYGSTMARAISAIGRVLNAENERWEES